jgi:hypothetical protein
LAIVRVVCIALALKMHFLLPNEAGDRAVRQGHSLELGKRGKLSTAF